jgi:hypothetical protein
MFLAKRLFTITPRFLFFLKKIKIIFYGSSTLLVILDVAVQKVGYK